jgi:signal transduction histidine kinase/ActR/RegA family two-component response regulator
MIRIGITAKILIPMGILFAVSTVLTLNVIKNLFAKEQIVTYHAEALATASQVAMMFDASTDAKNMKRIVTLIALNDHVERAVIVSPSQDEVIASSYYRHANHQVGDMPKDMQRSYLQTKKNGTYTFTDVNEGLFALAYPVSTIASNNYDSLHFILVVEYDTFYIEEQFGNFGYAMNIIASVFFLTSITAIILLISAVIRRPLRSFEDALRNQSTSKRYELLDQTSNDEFGDIAREFNRMQKVEQESLAAANKATEEAKSLAEKKSQFLANMSHEIRTPINGILGLTQLCLQADTEQQRRGYLAKMSESTNLLLTVVNDILDFSKLNEKAMSLHLEDISITSCVGPVVDLIQVTADKKSIDFSVHITNSVPIFAQIDIKRVQQVLLNILNNAIKFTEKGKVILTVDFAWDNPHEGNLILRVLDSGIGMTDAQQAHLFIPFEQADTSISRHYGGTGLGLAICSELVGLMRGSIDVKSKLKRGSQFCITLPCEGTSLQQYIDAQPSLQRLPTLSVTPSDKVKARTQYIVDVINQHATSASTLLLEDLDTHWQEAPHILDERVVLSYLLETDGSVVIDNATPEPFKDKQYRILVVEDNEINAIVIENMLIHQACSVVIANNGLEAVSEHQKQDFDAILMDVQMPIMDGLEATSRIRQYDDNIPIIGLSANALDEDREKAFAAGMDDYLHKPIKLEILMGAINKLLLHSPSRSRLAPLEDDANEGSL